MCMYIYKNHLFTCCFTHKNKFLMITFNNYRHLPLIKVGVSSTSSVSNSQEYLQHVSMLPTGGLIVIKDNDIFYKPAIKVDTVEQITKTGDPGILK